MPSRIDLASSVAVENPYKFGISFTYLTVPARSVVPKPSSTNSNFL